VLGGGMPMVHAFGGPWTEVKLDAVQYYLECYAKALTRAGMDIWYIDAFAGTGDREASREVGGIFDGRPIETITETLDGSARRALQVEPPFQHFVFIENDPERCDALEALRLQTDRDVQVIRAEANATLLKMVNGAPWSARDRSRSRGVVFLDPYALEVDWATLVALARTHVLDVWYLFPLESVLRQLARRISGVGVKAPRLDRMLSPAWRELYQLPTAAPVERLDIFDTRQPEELQRAASAKQVEEWFRGRLADIFSYVPEPVPLLRSTNRQMFSLFLCVANPSNAATDLADNFMRYVRQGRKPASRRKSVR
jgi:three-Cys-motif partner protein